MANKYGMHPVRAEITRLAQEPSPPPGESPALRKRQLHKRRARVLRPAAELAKEQERFQEEVQFQQVVMLAEDLVRSMPPVDLSPPELPVRPFKERKPPELTKPGTRTIDRPRGDPYRFAFKGRPLYGRFHNTLS